ncbi:EAL domain-containing protein [Nitratireductor pacificus]|uniref:Diguanylate phosphodiesterase n=1 Tax=Nitratireductor pacificus pht-3B TaxID=391937 RepID=K2M777_9HYPH|nr:EAL domain-containing protein [Nitratireductor pacificus]EKF18031.1 diguanylate phosphodiesterase [Nitratireductor pacificus pht-3B]
MSRSIGLAHIIRQPDGTAVGVWGAYTLKSAFQPIFSFRDGRLLATAYEGLVRPFRDGQPVSPGIFFSSVPEVDRFHVETLARTLHLLNAGADANSGLDPEAALFVNFDPSHFTGAAAGKSALRDTQIVLKEAGIEPGRVVCEITEQETRSDETLLDFVRALKDYGHRVAVDDYGAESSDMQRIEALAPDIVKFDGEWTGRLLGSAPGIALLTDMVQAFSKRNIRTVFEGIEDGRQVELAEQCGVSMVQGFALARPQLAPTAFNEFRAAREAVRREILARPALVAERVEPEMAPPQTKAPRAGRVFGRRGA